MDKEQGNYQEERDLFPPEEEDSFELFFSDLNEDAKRRYLEFLDIGSPEEASLDIHPLCIIEKSAEEIEEEE